MLRLLGNLFRCLTTAGKSGSPNNIVFNSVRHTKKKKKKKKKKNHLRLDISTRDYAANHRYRDIRRYLAKSLVSYTSCDIKYRGERK